MRRASRSAFVVTVSALTACNAPPKPPPNEHTSVHTPPVATTEQPPSEVPHVIDEPGRDASTTTDPDPEAPVHLSEFPTTLNPRDAQDRVIKRMWQGDQCFVELPFPPGVQRPPGSAPPSKTIPCPAAMLTPEYEQCRGGVIRGQSGGSACICFVMGNPPPPPRRLPCPKP